MKYATIEDRLLYNSFLNPFTGCWEWLGRYLADGYGRLDVRRGGKHVSLLAHRVSYEVFVGCISLGNDVDHTCPFPLRHCINPAHLRLAPYKEHRLDAMLRRYENGYHEAKWRYVIEHWWSENEICLP